MKLFAQIMRWLPIVFQVVGTIEANLPTSTGPEKKAAAMTLLQPELNEATAEHLYDMRVTPDEHTAAVSKLVDTVVKVNNEAGVFQTTQTTAAKTGVSA